MPTHQSNRPSARAMARLLLGAVALLVLSFATTALAAGRTQWTNTHPKEREDESWRLEVAIFFTKAPDVPSVPMKFEFKPTMYYARDMMDGDKIVTRKVPRENEQDIIEGVDVGFLDPSNGKIQPRTKFSFKVTRAHGFEAGEYKVSIRDTRNGQIIGTPITLYLEGENKVVDRRTMDFSASGGTKKKEDMKRVDRDGDIKDDPNAKQAQKPAASDDASGAEPADDGAAAGEESAAPAASDDSEPDGDNGAEGGPRPIKEKPGCSCRLEDAGEPASPLAWLTPLGLIAALGLRRRRRAA
ncbi:MAG: MYXO-CTERM sorting domain-containing protein [Sorangiineae bacterium]|nr:MYXO-CTERM sorting domain-containing protein [Polyangiaceae bacterium]MEB2322246.1 MYXO-CTERM sorting domain-containing protein [Sorangiineae bacterium]